jgi:hypothetical protein
MKNSFYKELERVFDKFPKCHEKILLGDFSAELGEEGIFKPIFRDESLHEFTHANKVLVNFATSKNLSVKSPISNIATFINLLDN